MRTIMPTLRPATAPPTWRLTIYASPLRQRWSLSSPLTWTHQPPNFMRIRKKRLPMVEMRGRITTLPLQRREPATATVGMSNSRSLAALQCSNPSRIA